MSASDGTMQADAPLVVGVVRESASLSYTGFSCIDRLGHGNLRAARPAGSSDARQ